MGSPWAGRSHPAAGGGARAGGGAPPGAPPAGCGGQPGAGGGAIQPGGGEGAGAGGAPQRAPRNGSVRVGVATESHDVAKTLLEPEPLAGDLQRDPGREEREPAVGPVDRA